MNHQIMLFVVFNIFVVFLLFLDLKVFHRNPHTVTVKEALWGSAFWIGLALAFCVGIHYFWGSDPALKFLAGFLIEKSLSVDNLFVFIVIFSYFKVSPMYQHRVLFWGILGALIMRAFFILAGVALINRFHWIMYVFGLFLIYTGYKLVAGKEKEMEPEKNLVFKLIRRWIPVTDTYHEEKFFVRQQGRLFATPLLIVLAIIETTDVVFAIDSIPAVLSVSRDPFIVYTSNVFAILGLRALYFALSGLMKMFYYLHYGLGVILVFVGIKMLIADIYHVPIVAALGFIVITLGVSIVVSLIRKPSKSMPEEPKH